MRIDKLPRRQLSRRSLTGKRGSDSLLLDMRRSLCDRILGLWIILIGLCVGSRALSYELGPGDRLRVTYWGLEQTSVEVTVEPDGRVAIHPAGRISLTGLTPEQAQSALDQALSAHFKNPQTTVSVHEYARMWILCLGAFNDPGQHGIRGRIHLLEALSLAGGLSSNANQSRLTVLRGENVLLQMDLRSLLNGSTPGLNILLEMGDILHVSRDVDQQVFVMGMVRQPGAVALNEQMDVLKALAMAGGTTEDAKSKVQILREEAGELRVVEVSIRKGRKGKLPPEALCLQDGDLIYVPSHIVAKFNYAVSELLPSLRAVVLAGATKTALETLEVLEASTGSTDRATISIAP